MIAKLKGLLDSTGDDWAVIDVGGVGYLVYCSGRTLQKLPAPGEACTVYVETHVREDHIHLYGFLTEGDRAFFRMLNTVQGVGSKVALSILSVASAEQLVQAIAAQDKALFTRANGVGPKVAGRIVSELKDKAAGLVLGAPVGLSQPVAATVGAAAPPDAGAIDEAVSALTNLGYGRLDAFSAVSRAAQAQGDGASTQSLLSAALKDLGKGL